MSKIRFLYSFSFMFILGQFGFFGCADSVGKDGINSLEKITLGGVSQTILIRGQNLKNPILLFLHGGPGFPEMPLASANSALERDFTMVYWDQYGAGKSYQPNIPIERMSVSHLLQDTLELTKLLQSRFNRSKIYLVGHSWGSLLGILAASQAPERYYAFVGIGQLVDINQSESVIYRTTLLRAQQQKDSPVERELQLLGPPPYHPSADTSKIELVKKYFRELGPKIPNRMTPRKFFWLALHSSYFNPLDTFKILRGYHFSHDALLEEIYRTNLFPIVTHLDVPAYFFIGRNDGVVTAAVTEKFFETLQDTKGKHMVFFEASDHWPQLEESSKFDQEMLKVKNETFAKEQ